MNAQVTASLAGRRRGARWRWREVGGPGGALWGPEGDGGRRGSGPRPSPRRGSRGSGAHGAGLTGRGSPGTGPGRDRRSAPARRSRGTAVVEVGSGSEAVFARALLPALLHLLHEVAAVVPG